MTHLLFLNAFALSVIAEYYAIMGLMAIFSGSPISIAVMGAVLGLSKIVITSWLYRNWKQTPIIMKSYFVTAIGILMLLTSMGIFGYLSKAHLEHGISLGDVGAEVALLDEKIKIQKENIDAARKTLTQLDSQVSAALDRSTTDAGADRSASIRRSQGRERTRAIEEINAGQKEIAKLNEERAPKATNLRKVEAEVGPIKYIAALIYDESTSQDSLEKAVRWVIILIVFVFDPLAVLMFIAVNQSIRPKEPPPEPIQLSIIEEPLEEIKEVEPEPEVEEPKVEPVVHLYVDEPRHVKMSGNVQVTDECKIERIVT
jgi:hypothetical protein